MAGKNNSEKMIQSLERALKIIAEENGKSFEEIIEGSLEVGMVKSETFCQRGTPDWLKDTKTNTADLAVRTSFRGGPEVVISDGLE